MNLVARLGLFFGLLAAALGCAKRKTYSLVLVDITAERGLAAPLDLELGAGTVHRTFHPNGLSRAQPTNLGLYVPDTGVLTVSASTTVDGCTYEGSTETHVDRLGVQVTAMLLLTAQGSCANTGDAGMSDGSATEGGAGNDAAAGDAAMDTTSSDASSPRDGAPDVMVATPPSLSNCRTFRQDLTPSNCDVGATPDDLAIHALAFSPDGKLLASTNGFGVTESWTVSGLDLKGNGSNMGGNAMNALAFSADSSLLAAAGESGEVNVWRVGAGWVTAFQVIGTASTTNYKWISFAADNDRVLTVQPLANSLKVWSVSRRGTAADVPTSPVAAAAASPAPPADGPWWVAVASTSNTISFFDLNAAGIKATTPFSVGVVRSLALSPDARTLAVAATDSLTLWDVSDKENPLPLLPALTSTLLPNDFQVAAFAPSGRYLLATVPRTGSVVLFDVSKRLDLDDLTKPGQPQAIAWSPDGRGVAIGVSCGLIYYCHD